MQPPTRHRGASKRVWVLITLVPVIGGILWWTIGRSRGQARPAPAAPLPPDDDPRFLASDERIRRLEEELAMLDAEEALNDPRAQDVEGAGPRDETANADEDPGDDADDPARGDGDDDRRDGHG